jgi:hypothetical protein
VPARVIWPAPLARDAGVAAPQWAGYWLACGQRCVAAPGSTGVDVLALAGGVMEAEVDDGGGAWAVSSRSAEIRPVRIGKPRLWSW